MLDFEKIVEYRNKRNRFARKLGIVVEAISPGSARVVKAIEEDDLNPWAWPTAGCISPWRTPPPAPPWCPGATPR